MGGNLLTKVWDNNEGNRPVESNSVVKVEQAPTNNLNSKLGTFFSLNNKVEEGSVVIFLFFAHIKKIRPFCL